MRTPGLAAITMALAIAACSDVAQPVAMDLDVPSLHFAGRSNPWDNSGHKLGDKKDQCADNDSNNHRWGKHHRYVRFRHWASGHNRRQWYFRGHDSSGDCDGGAKTGSISGTVTNEGTLAAGYSVFLLSSDAATVVASTTTDDTGAYSFAAVEAGSYLVCEDNPFTEAHAFLGETRPQTGGACPQPAYGPRGFALTLAAGATLAENNFSNMRLD